MAKKQNSELTLALDGEVTAKDLATSMEAFAKLLDALAEKEAPGVALEWIVSDLRPGSAATSASPRTIDPEEVSWIPRIIEGGHRFAEAMERGDTFDGLPSYSDVAKAFRGLVRGRLLRVRLESPERDFVLVGKPRADAGAAPNIKAITFGSVRGRVQAMSKHGALRFTLFDVNDDRAVSCYLAEGEEQRMLGLWGRMVEVEGWIRRDVDTGRAITVRKIEGIAAIPVSRPWKEALGAAQGFLGDETSEDVVRRGRDE